MKVDFKISARDRKLNPKLKKPIRPRKPSLQYQTLSIDTGRYAGNSYHSARDKDFVRFKKFLLKHPDAEISYPGYYSYTLALRAPQDQTNKSLLLWKEKMALYDAKLKEWENECARHHMLRLNEMLTKQGEGSLINERALLQYEAEQSSRD